MAQEGNLRQDMQRQWISQIFPHGNEHALDNALLRERLGLICLSVRLIAAPKIRFFSSDYPPPAPAPTRALSRLFLQRSLS